ncbi:MAG TPA: thiamine-phosphate kinase [Alphaproteobacteria bacterium]
MKAPTNPKKSGEFEIIARYFAPLAAGVPGAFGLKDDAAFLEIPEGHELVAKTDAAVATVHFMADDPPDLIARKTLRRNLSDLAAKGAVPHWYLLDAAFPRDVGDAWIAGFARGLARDQAEFGVHLVGGDTKSTPGPATFAITLLGLVRASWGLHRSGAHPGDELYVTGTIGDGALGLLARKGELGGLKPKAREQLIDRYRLPRPRVAVGPQLLGVATAAIDVSDGLVADAGHISSQSKLAIVLEEKLLPLSAPAKAALAETPALIERVLTGGDDYEILFTAPASVAKVLEHLAGEMKVPITRIGRTEAGKGVTVLDAAGRRRELAQAGWVHF